MPTLHSQVGDAPAWRQALLSDTESIVVVLAPDLTILELNPVAESVLGPGAGVGTRVDEALPPEVAAERRAAVAKVVETGRPIALINMLRGRWMRCTFRPVPDEQGRITAVLAVSKPLPSDGEEATDGLATYIAKARDMGPLAKLSPREIEILGLLGRGMSIPEIARQLERSVKTVEWHRNALGEKLHVSNRVELARIAADAGLDRAFPHAALPTLT